MINRRWLVVSLLVLAPWLQAQSVHVHGQGQLQVSAEQDQLSILLVLPAMDVVGFEHAPSSPEQQAKVSEANARLASSKGIVLADTAAQCTVQSVKVDSLHGHDHDHADFSVEYWFLCGKPQLLGQLSLPIFQWLPELQLRAEVVTEHGATVATLNRDSAILLMPAAP